MMLIGILRAFQSLNLALESVINNRKLPKIFDANDKLNVYRAAKISEGLI